MCTDSDRSDKYTKGTVTFISTSGTQTYEDTCSGRSSVVEYLCKDNTLTRESITCESGCKDGKCQQCIPNIQCREWSSCSEQVLSGSEGRENRQYSKSRTCTDMNRCVADYIDTQDCCGDSSMTGRAIELLGACEMKCEASRECSWTECTSGSRSEICVNIDETCYRWREIGETERCEEIKEIIEEPIEETVIVDQGIPDERFTISEDQKSMIVEEAIDYINQISDEKFDTSDLSNVDIRLDENDKKISEHTTSTIKKLDQDYLTNEENKKEIEQLYDDSITGQQFALKHAENIHTVSIKRRDSNESKNISAITIITKAEDDKRKAVNNVKIVQYIPNSVAQNENELHFIGNAPKVLERSPELIIEWDV